ncbi:MAG: type II toxin-antitoxin system ParD family antitoxin [Planctomycetaceae bacterium]|nr:type II toxin-antitoxin system ParD family antitoxin [Planctomycetaceae bacterium]
MPTRNINLTDHFDKFVSMQIEDGRYHNASEVLRAGLRLLEQQEAEERTKLELLKSLAKEGFDELDQGKGIELQGDDELIRHIRTLGKKASKQVAGKRRRKS